jgi:hypothetical protein
MTEDRFDELMRDAAQTYRNPPEAPLDEMWAAIEARGLGHGARGVAGETIAFDSAVARRGFHVPRWAAIAATLVIGVGLGRASTALHRSSASQAGTTPPTTVASVTPTHADSIPASNPYELETSKYLGQTAALLIALPTEVKQGGANQQFVARAGDLLTTTRLLIDSPASSDPAMRNLLEDLELVLAQVVRLQNSHSRTELDLINRALEQRDVIPRLRTAVADISAN